MDLITLLQVGFYVVLPAGMAFSKLWGKHGFLLGSVSAILALIFFARLVWRRHEIDPAPPRLF
ncbi:MAG: hypothetical protein AAGE52_03375 [Myxococcota bacterium]